MNEELYYTRKDIFRILNHWQELNEWEITDDHFLHWDIEMMMPQLSFTYQITFQLWIQGYSTNEIANMLDLSESATLKRKYRLTCKLTNMLNEE